MHVVFLPERLDLGADALPALLREAIATGPLVLDGSAVTRVDAAGVQLVYAAVAGASGPVTWVNPSPILCSAVATLGLAALLHLDVAKEL